MDDGEREALMDAVELAFQRLSHLESQVSELQVELLRQKKQIMRMLDLMENVTQSLLTIAPSVGQA